MNKLLTFSVLLVTNQASYALGPVDLYAKLNWWNTETTVDIGESDVDFGTYELEAEAWLNNSIGLSGRLTHADIKTDSLQNESRTQVLGLYKILEFSDDNYLALGAGYESIKLTDSSNIDGLKLAANAKIGLFGIVSLYGNMGWTPSLSDTDTLTDISAQETEVGIELSLAPFVTSRLGYRRHELSFDSASDVSETRVDGVLLGIGLEF